MASYSMPIGFVGQQDTMIDATFISRTVEGSTNIKSGDPVMIGTGGRFAKPSDGSGTFLGIACGTSLVTEWGENDTVRIMTEGAIVLKASDTVEAGDKIGFNGSGEWAKAAASTYDQGIDGSQADTDAGSDELFRARIQGTAITEEA